jgi:hypothetical protein
MFQACRDDGGNLLDAGWPYHAERAAFAAAAAIGNVSFEVPACAKYARFANDPRHVPD